MKKYFLFLIVFLCSYAFAADHYIVPGLATGSHTGANCTNAYSGFGTSAGQVNPASLTRGDTYWLLAGTLGTGINFSTAASSTTVITIEAATTLVHGQATDCTGLYGQTVFGADAQFTTSYWTINGQGLLGTSCSGLTCNVDSAYSIYFHNSTDTNGFAVGAGPGTNFTFNYVDMGGPHQLSQWSSNTGICGSGATNYGDDILVTPGGSADTDNLYVGHSYLHDAGTDIVGSNNQTTASNTNGNGYTYEYDFFARDWYTGTDSSTCNHSQTMSMCATGLIVRYNVFLDSVQDGMIDVNVNTTCPIADWDIYGNTIEWDNNIPTARQANTNGFLGFFGQTIASGHHINVYNNTMAGVGGYQSSGAFVSPAWICWSNGVGSTNAGTVNIYNNLFWNSGSTGGSVAVDVGCGTIPGTSNVDYTQGFCPATGCTNGAGYTPTGAHSLNSNTGNPFVNWNGSTNFNVSLTADTSAGLSISGWTTAPTNCYPNLNCQNIDPALVARGANGTIDRGAFQIQESACHTVSPAGTGSKSGADWNNTMSWNSGITFVRGDSYYIQTGSYNSATLNTASSGAGVITIKAVTSGDNCTATGFNAGTMVGQATFTAPIAFGSDYWTFTGVYRTNTGNPLSDWTNESGYGFKVNNQVAQAGTSMNGGSGFTGSTCTSLANCNATGVFIHHITISYVDINGAHTKTDAGDIDGGIDFEGGSYNLDFSHIYLHDAAVPFFLRGNHNGQAGSGYFFGSGDSNTIEYTYIQNNYSSPTNHSEGCSCSEGMTNFTFRWNISDQIGGTGSNGATAHLATASGCATAACNGTNGPWFIYGNIFTCSSTNANQNCAVGDGALAMWATNFGTNNVYFLNNTINDIGPHGLDGGIQYGLGYTGSNISNVGTLYSENNLWFNNDTMNVIVTGTTSFGGSVLVGTTWAYNSYFQTPTAASNDTDGNKQTSSSNPFASSTCCNLASNTTAGVNTHSLLPLNDIDMNGVTRGANGTIDRGALQLSNNVTHPPTLFFLW